jgi:hypothetical protein
LRHTGFGKDQQGQAELCCDPLTRPSAVATNFTEQNYGRSFGFDQFLQAVAGSKIRLSGLQASGADGLGSIPRACFFGGFDLDLLVPVCPAFGVLVSCQCRIAILGAAVVGSGGTFNSVAGGSTELM